MALSVVPLTNVHLLCLSTRSYSGGVDLRRADVRKTLLDGDCFAVIDYGEVYAAAGVVPMWGGVGHGWATIAIPTGVKRLRFLTKQVKYYLDTTDKWRRIQTTVCADFNQGVAWATHFLGFTPEGLHLKYDEYGRDHIMLARVT